MNKILAIALAAGVTLAAAGAADARDGCGAGLYRGSAGYCRPLRARGPVVVAPRPVYVAPRPVIVGPRLAIGSFYPGRGYWDGRRYYQHRYRYHGYWRYR